MGLLKKEMGKFTLGIWIALGALGLIMLAWLMQAYSLLDWERSIQIGLQAHGFAGNETERALATIEKGLAWADIIWPLPITIVAFSGLLRKKMWGFVAAMMEFAMCVYFPIFFAFQYWTMFPGTAVAAIALWAIPSLLGIAGLWANRGMFK